MGGEESEICSSQIAGLYLRLGEYERASGEFIQLLKAGEGNVGMVQQRLAQYMTDSLSRTTILRALEGEITTTEQTPATYRLLTWIYTEQKDYAKALETTLKLDNMSDRTD